MPVTTIYVTRHGFRGNWTVDHQTGEYKATTGSSPTGIASDPALAAYGVLQSQQLTPALSALPPPAITRVYSSPFYRCLQTLQPYVEKANVTVRGDNGIGEWYGLARFTHPSPATPEVLKGLFPWYEVDYRPSIVPSSSGESYEDLHDRCAYALSHIIAAEDAEEDQEDVASEGKGREKALLICTHAASMIAVGRALTGRMPKDVSEDDFKTFTCGISKFVRREVSHGKQNKAEAWRPGQEIPKIDWKNGKGVAGGWNCVVNSDCSHLDGGEERGWQFHGDEMFGYTLDGDASDVDVAERTKKVAKL